MIAPRLMDALHARIVISATLGLIWQGSAVGLVSRILWRSIPTHLARARYAVGCAGLVSIVVLAVVPPFDARLREGPAGMSTRPPGATEPAAEAAGVASSAEATKPGSGISGAQVLLGQAIFSNSSNVLHRVFFHLPALATGTSVNPLR
jgi:predicted lipid-binding transport protein (Tim44 family)